jgi:hypothetical protein
MEEESKERPDWMPPLGYNEVTQPTNVYPGTLMISDADSAWNRELRETHDIGAILSFSCDGPIKGWTGEYLLIAIHDFPKAPIYKHFAKCFNFIQSNLEASRNVLVH